MAGTLGAYRLLGVPMNEISGHVVDLSELVGVADRRLAEVIAEAPTWSRRFAVMDEFLLRRFDDGPRPSPEVGQAWRRLVATGGTMPIGRIADEVGWSHRHLISRFRQQLWLPPKKAARLIRFDRVLGGLSGHRSRLGHLAADHGYSDQAQLSRDFGEFTGTTSTEFLAGVEVSSIQDIRVTRA